VQVFQARYHAPKVRIGKTYGDVGMNFVWKKIVRKRLAGRERAGRGVEWRVRVFPRPTNWCILDMWRSTQADEVEYDGGYYTNV
jgi:hypothetical protein